MKNKSSQRRWTIRQTANNIFVVDIEAQENAKFNFVSIDLADVHHDSLKSDHARLGDYCELAASSGGMINCWGDLLDCMGSKYDPRSSKSELRSNLIRDTYTDDVVNFCADWFIKNKFHKYIGVLGEGNHEAEFRKRFETDLVQRVIAILNSKGATAKFGAYSGAVKYRFKLDRKKSGNCLIQGYHHGSGYSSRTKLIEFAMQHPDCNFFSMGHHHNFTVAYEAIKRFTEGGFYHDRIFFLANPSLKNDHGIKGDGSTGWSVHKGIRAKPLGCWKLNFYYCRRDNRFKVKPEPMD